jgi:predicted  nucleic acid-binding Zn-ribbon protein
MTNCEKYDRIHGHYNVNTNYYNNSYEKNKENSEHTNIPKTRKKSKDLDSEIQKMRKKSKDLDSEIPKIKPRIANKITKININICSFRFMRNITKIRLLPIFKYFGSPKIVPT